MTDEPLSGDVVPLRGPYQGTFRRRVGAGRILFAAMPEARIVIIHDIVRRTSVTY
jgi:mRNA-degrading endonuclease RelE of RelBE toxin-antitoxin system